MQKAKGKLQNVSFSFTFCFLRFAFWALPITLNAKHIVGGEITYKYVSTEGVNVKLAFTMRIYRDCAGGGVGFDGNAPIGNFIKNGGRYGQVISVPIKQVRKIDAPSYKCLIPPNVCVEEGLYEWEAEFSNQNEGYVVEYQRCCRNETITNVYQPGELGATYSVEITKLSLQSGNSSPVFNTFPPTIICLEKYLDFDHAATDAEGDQIVYKFCLPSGGGGKSMTSGIACNSATPNPPCYPPGGFDVQFKVPTYTVNAPLGGNPIISIDPNTGKITGKPLVQGQFVVGVCAEEYRNGKLLSVLQRDFQFNVAPCVGVIEAKIKADTVIQKNYILNVCGTDSLKIINLSFDPKNVTESFYDIQFGSIKKRFTQWEPIISFPDTGVFAGKLFLNPNSNCNDTIDLTFNVAKSAQALFDLKYDTCVAGAVSFTDKSFSENGKIINWKWNFGDSTEISAQINPTHVYSKPGFKSVNLSVTDAKKCRKDVNRSFNWQPAPAIIIVEPSSKNGCTPLSVLFNNLSTPFDSIYKIKWTFNDSTVSNKPNPTKIFDRAGTYSVGIQITSPIGCSALKNFPNITKARQGTKANFDYSPTKVNTFNNTVNFVDKSENATSWFWYFNSRGYSQLQNPVFTFRDTGLQQIKLITSNVSNCNDTLVKFFNLEQLVSYYLPNVFTPNNDNVNDVYKGVGITLGISAFKFTIWNRWGERIYGSENLTEGWNGKINNFGDDAPSGVYLCVVNYITPSGEYKEVKTYVTLIR